MTKTIIVFKASRTFVTLFYALLVTWTLVSVPLLISKYVEMSNSWIAMTAFIILITWYWSFGLVYHIELENNEIVRMKSLRRNITLNLDDFRKIEGPPSRIEFGFIRFRLTKDTIYAFFCSSEPLRKILTTIRKQSPGTHFVKFSPGYFKGSLL